MIALYSGRRPETGPAARAILLDYGDDTPAKEAFYRLVADRSARQMHNFWIQRVFSGAGRGPTYVRDTADMLATIRREPGAVGYLWSDQPIDGLDVLWRSALP